MRSLRRPISYGEYLCKEVVRNKEKRLKVIKTWYDFITKTNYKIHPSTNTHKRK